MGAINFTDYAEAYSKAAGRARAEYGTDPYNGTITTTGGATPVYPTALPYAAAARLAGTDKVLDTLNKWEAAGAIPVAEDRHFGWRNKTITVTTTGNRWEAAVEAEGKLDLRPGERVSGVDSEVISKTRKVTDRATKGKVVTRYYVTAKGRPISAPYDTQASARKAAVTEAHRTGSTLGVIGVKTREDGGTLVEVKAETKHKVKVKFRLATPKGNPPVKGWMFCGWAAS
jgi:hypothetical protein